MYRKVYIASVILSSVILSHATSVSGSTQLCPVIHAKPAEECVGIVSNCWSAGQYDVDCSNGDDVCCFNGCANVCGKPQICKTVYQTRLENVTKEMCLPVEQPDRCSVATTELCWDDCKQVEETVVDHVDEEICKTVSEEVCSSVESEMCIYPEVDGSVPSCPLIHLKPSEECVGAEPSNCWSPGVPDIDCQDNELCCFNGCSNRCLKKECQIDYEDVCTVTEVENCTDIDKEICNVIVVPVLCSEECTTLQEEICEELTEKVCHDEPFTECKNVETVVPREVKETVCVNKTVPECKVKYVKKCEGSKLDSYKPYVCKKVPQETCVDTLVEECNVVINTVDELVTEEACEEFQRPVCQDVVKPDCKLVDKKECFVPDGCTKNETKCDFETEKVCVQLPVEQCSVVAKEVCPECVMRNVTNTVCKMEPRHECRTESRPVEKQQSNEVCNKVCEPRTEKICVPVEPKIECNTVVKEMSYPVPVLSCD